MKSSKAQITAKFHKILMIRFEDQQIASFSGLLVFQLLFKRLKLRFIIRRGCHINEFFSLLILNSHHGLMF